MPKKTKKQVPTTEIPDANPDPITGAPGAHPVGTGIGATGGAAAGAAIGAAMGGPVGAAVGLVAGAIAGGLAGKGAAEAVNPTAEEAYWRENYVREPYVDRSKTYDEYQGAYRTGYEGYSKYGAQSKRFEEVEPSLKTEYDKHRGKSTLGWDQARHAARAAWEKVSGNLERLIGYKVVDQNEKEIGSVENLWADQTGQPAYLGVRTAQTANRHYVVPAQSARVSYARQKIKLPFLQQRLEGAPSFAPEADFTDAMEEEVARYYSLQTPRSAPTAAHSTTSEEATMQLKEETMTVGKREVDAGGVRLRKVVRTETVNRPVELQREEVVVERVPASGDTATGTEFEEQEVYMPLRREEAVVDKETRVREEVRADKRTETERQNVSGTVRKEDVEIERQGGGSPWSAHESYWRQNYASAPYYDAGRSFDDYQGAYRTGVEGYSRHQGKSFDQVENELRNDYERHRGSSSLTWEKAKAAARAAWDRVERALPGDADGDGR
jgi:uncharacterized protein (TIGR02271 family)